VGVSFLVVGGVFGGDGERTICFLCSGVCRSMCMRWTRAGSSWGSRGWRPAGAVVKGVGIAFEFDLTAAAGLAKDFAERLLIAIFEDGGSGPAVVCGYVVGGWCVSDLGGNRKLNGIALGTYRDISYPLGRRV
jgi:hypothetical protein